jgi:hypothetical protein
MMRRVFVFLESFLFITGLLWLTSCEKDTKIVTLYMPKAEIISAKAVSLTTFEVIYQINPGNKEKLERAEIIFDDITVLGALDIVKEIKITQEEKQIDTVRLNLNQMNHDFIVKIKLNSEQNFWLSNEKIVRSSKCIFKISLPQLDYTYSDLKNNISSIRNNTDTIISISIDFSVPFEPKTIEVKLNDNIVIRHNLSFKNYTSNSAGLGFSAGGSAFFPENVPAGIYEVYVIIDSIKFKADTKIKTLEDDWSLINTSFPGENLLQNANFIVNDNLFLINGDPIWQPNIPKVWRCDLKSGSWIALNNFPVPVNQNRKIYGFSLKYKEEGYLVLRNPFKNDSTELWKYNYGQDSWSIVATYPGFGKDVICFFINDDFYAGCGRRRIGDNVLNYKDYWKFNMITGVWKQLNNSPVEFSCHNNASCAGEGKAYVYYSYNKALWEYDPLSDNWNQLEKFIGPLRENTSLVYLNKKIYLLGGEYINVYTQNLKDCWVYSLEKKEWNLNSFIPSYSNRGVACAYQNKILIGLGYAVAGNIDINKPNIYSLLTQ